MTVDSPTAFSPLRLAEAWETDAEFRRAVSVAYQKHVDGRPRLKFANETVATEPVPPRIVTDAMVNQATRIMRVSAITAIGVWEVMWTTGCRGPSFLEVMENYYG